MLTLALDTSTDLASLGLSRDGRLLAECAFSARAAHSETVLPEIERLLDRCGASAGDVDRVVVGAGPGSFTGVRIGASLAKGWCAARGTELLAYSGLAAVAAATGLDGRVCVAFRAREDRVYAAAYRRMPPLDPVVGPCALRVAELPERLGDGWTFAGTGALAHRKVLEEAGGRVLGELHARPRAAALLELGRACPTAGRVGDPADWEPRYALAPGAERGVG